MSISRRHLVTRLPLALAAPAVPRARAADAPPGAMAVHQATRNTWLGAFGELLPDLQAPPPRYKAYAGRERLPLPPAESPGRAFVEALSPPSEPRAAQTLALADIARQLRLANGVTGRLSYRGGTLHLRAAPSAGALYANELYLLAQRVDGLAPGAYYYDVIDDALVPVASGPPESDMALALESRTAAAAPAWLGITSVFERYRFRYANRGYRYALIDAGHIGENFTLAARAAGLPVQRIDRFADGRIEALLGVNGIDEAVCAVHVLGSASGNDRSPGVRLEPAVAPLEAADDILERYHTATRLVAGPAGTAPSIPAPRTDAPIVIDPLRPAVPLDATIRERRSTRELRDRPLSADALDYLARAAGAPLVHAPALSLHVVVHRVADMAPGHYRYDTGSHSLALLREADLRNPLRRACLRQQKAGAAAAVFLSVADLPAAVALDDERAYRHLLLDAGAMGQRVYLAAEAAGLTARNLAAYIDDDLNELLGLDGRERAVAHLTVAGHGD